MAVTLHNRVSQIIVGSAHALLDKVEDQAPEAMMEQAIRKVEGVIDDVRTELGRAAANRHLAQQQHADLSVRHLEFTTKAEEAIALQREDLGRVAVTQQLSIEAQIPIIKAILTDITAKEKELSGYVDALIAKKREMEEALTQFIASRKVVSAPGSTAAGNTTQVTVDKASDSFERVFRRHSGMALLTQKISADETAKLQELADLVQSKKVDARLVQLRVGKS